MELLRYLEIQCEIKLEENLLLTQKFYELDLAVDAK